MLKILLIAFCFLQLPSLAQNNKITVRMDLPPSSWDWNNFSVFLDAPIMNNTQEGLFRYDGQSKKIVPGLAESVKTSTDGKKITFKIKDNALWSDGRPVFAADFLYSWQRLLSPQSTSPFSFYLFDIDGARDFKNSVITDVEKVGIKAIDDKTLEIHLTHPVPRWEDRTLFWSFFPTRKDQVEKYGNSWWKAGILLSSGPFVLDSFEAGKKAVLKRNSKYQGAGTNLVQVDLVFNNNFDESLKEYEQDKISVINDIPYDRIKSLLTRADYRILPTPKIYFLILNHLRYPLNQKKYRSAILKSIDPDQVIERQNPTLLPAYSFIPNSILKNYKSENLYFKNEKEAVQILKKSGIKIDQKNKIPFVSLTKEPYAHMAKQIQKQLEKNIQLPIDLLLVDGVTMKNFQNMGNFGLFLTSWTYKTLLPQDFLLLFQSTVANNLLSYSNSDFDDAISMSTDPLRATKIFQVEDSIALPIAFESTPFLVKQSLRSVTFDYMGVLQLRDVVK